MHLNCTVKEKDMNEWPFKLVNAEDGAKGFKQGKEKWREARMERNMGATKAAVRGISFEIVPSSNLPLYHLNSWLSILKKG